MLERRHPTDGGEVVPNGMVGRFRTLVEQLPLSVYIDRLDDVSSNVYTSPQIEQMLGYSVAEWVENHDLFVEILHPDDRERVLAAHQRTHATGEPLFIEYRLRTRDGRYVWVQDEARVVTDAGGAVLQGYLLDITARREAEEQLRHQAFHDALTGLANRALFTNRVEHALVLRSQLARAEVAVLFLDLDDFKGVNDTLGHVAGDTLLRGVGVRLRDSLSPSYTVARLGGDEFAVLIEEVAGPASAVDAAERLVASLQTPFDIEGREVFVSASVGIALGTVADDLLRAADVAMYRAKASGKAQCVMYVPTMTEDLVGRLELVAELRRARREGFIVHYQPLVDLESRAVVGVEALVRWAHATRGLLPPGEFIALAEETGKIVEIGAWVLDEACAQVARWRAETPGAAALTLNVNVSTRQVRPGVLVESVRTALAESGLASRGAHPRAHGERARAKARGAARCPGGRRRPRCAHRARRLRHRLLLALAPPGPAGPHAEGRPLVRECARRGCDPAGIRPGDRRSRADARRVTGGRGHGDRRRDDRAAAARLSRWPGVPLRSAARGPSDRRASRGGRMREPRRGDLEAERPARSRVDLGRRRLPDRVGLA